jgi:F-type H+-transporting ATPase subunit alpha
VNGHLDNIPVKDITAFEAQFLSAIRSSGAAILKSIRDEQKITDENKAALAKFAGDFVTTFSAGKKAA